MSITLIKIIQYSHFIPFSLKKGQRKYLWLIPSLFLHGLAIPEGGWLNLEEDTFANRLVSLFSVFRYLTAVWSVSNSGKSDTLPH